MASATINLLKTRSGRAPEWAGIEHWLRVVSLGLLGLILFSGAALGAAYAWLTQETNRLEQEKATLSQQIASERAKEGLLLSIKKRTALTEKVLGVQHSMASVLDVAQTIAPGNQLLSVVVDEQQQIRVVAKTASVEDAAAVLLSLMQAVETKRIVSAQLVGLELEKDGGVRLTVSFVQRTVSG